MNNLKEKDTTIVFFWNAGLGAKEISAKTGYSYTRVIQGLNRQGINIVEENRVRRKEEYKRELKRREEARREDRIQELSQMIEERTPGFTYYGNYAPNGDKGTVDVQCKVCGTVKTISLISLRHKSVRCSRCYEEELRQYHEQKNAKRQREQYIKDLEKKAKREAKSQQIKFNLYVCKECGKPFAYLGNQRVFCSEECRHKGTNRRKDKRIKPEQQVDNITLPELYRRDEGICYICGTKCNWDDFTETIGSDNRMAKIVGPTYPTIEHVKPLSKGGLHSWGNVRLACFECNTKKSSYWEE